MKSKTVKVGIFLVVGIGLFCVGLFLIGTSANLFGKHFVVYTKFDNVDTLVTGAAVRVSGMDAGEVKGISVPSGPGGQFRLELSVDQKFHPVIRQDSVATIETEGMVGNKFVNIAMGAKSSAECPAGCTLPSHEPVSMAQLIQQGTALATQLRGAIQHADVAIENFAAVGKNANVMVLSMKPKIDQMMGNADAIIAGVRDGRGVAGELLSNREVASSVAATVANAKQSSANLAQTSRNIDGMVSTVQSKDLPGIHQTVQNAQQLTGRINQAVGTFVGSGKQNENTATAVRETIDQAKQAMANLEGDTEAIKTNFLLRGFFNRRGFYDLSTITPSKYIASRFVKGPKARVWIPADELFKSDPNGAPQLTEAGRAALDKSMSGLVPYLPNNPIVVEGYAGSGAPDQQYLISRQRALEVREYLVQRFHLQSKRIGIMPFADRPPGPVGKQSWNGVCLVLVVSQRQDSLF